MPLSHISQAPQFLTQEQHNQIQQSTPGSFAELPPLLHLELQNVLCHLAQPLPSSDGTLANGANHANGKPSHHATLISGTLWVTEAAISFLDTASTSGWTLDYPSLSLHAISRSPPDPLVSTAAAQFGAPLPPGAGCIYCQVDEGIAEDDMRAAEDAEPEANQIGNDGENDGNGGDDEEDEGVDGLKELWLLPKQQAELEPLFQALSSCASLHPSFGGDDGDSHPFAAIGPFGTGANAARAEAEGAFEDADDDGNDDVDVDAAASAGGATAQGEDTTSGRRQAVLAHLESLVDWDSVPGLPTAVDPPTDTAHVDVAERTRPEAKRGLRRGLSTAVSPTNVLHLHPLPRQLFDHPELVASLLDLLHAYGALSSWTPLPSLQRAIVVFGSVEGATRAKAGLDGIVIPFTELDQGEREEPGAEAAGKGEAQGAEGASVGGGDLGRQATASDESVLVARLHDERTSLNDDVVALRAYFGRPADAAALVGGGARPASLATDGRIVPREIGDDDGDGADADDATSRYLAVPTSDRNFLISPPGSPPVGWRPVREDPPNTDTLADDLIRALGRLRDQGGDVSGFVPPQGLGDDEERNGEAGSGASIIEPTTTQDGVADPTDDSMIASGAKDAADGDARVREQAVATKLPEPTLVLAPTSVPPPPRHRLAKTRLPTARSMFGRGQGAPGSRDGAARGLIPEGIDQLDAGDNAKQASKASVAGAGPPSNLADAVVDEEGGAADGKDDDQDEPIAVPGVVVQLMEPEPVDAGVGGAASSASAGVAPPPPHARSISSVKATIESLRGRRPSIDDGGGRAKLASEVVSRTDAVLAPTTPGGDSATYGASLGRAPPSSSSPASSRSGTTDRRITPTARPPLAG